MKLRDFLRRYRLGVPVVLHSLIAIAACSQRASGTKSDVPPAAAAASASDSQARVSAGVRAGASAVRVVGGVRVPDVSEVPVDNPCRRRWGQAQVALGDNIAFVKVTHNDQRRGGLNGAPWGYTNEVLPVPAGNQRFDLGDPVDYIPPRRTASGGADAQHATLVEFK
jgi:hypothetical protein